MVSPSLPGSENEQELRERIQAGSQAVEDYRSLARLLVSAQRHEDAVSVYQQALRLGLTNFQRAEGLLELGWIHYDGLGHQARALDSAREALSLLSTEPHSPVVAMLRGTAHALHAHSVWQTDLESGRQAARLALKELARVVAGEPEPQVRAQACMDSARLWSMLGQPEQAILTCRDALQHELNEVDRLSCLTILTDALERAGRMVEAEQVLEEAFQRSENDPGSLPRLYFERGLIQRAMNRPAEARRAFQQVLTTLEKHPALRNDPDYLVGVHKNLGEIAYDAHEYKQALIEFEVVLRYRREDDADRRNALLWLGHCCAGLGQHARARDCYEEVLGSRGACDEETAAAREGLAALPPLPERKVH